jgi:hypothetical protein
MKISAIIKDLFALVILAAGGYLVYKVWQAIQTVSGAYNGVANTLSQFTPSAIADDARAAWNSVAGENQDNMLSTVVNGPSDLASLPALQAQSQSLDQTIIAANTSDWQPGGRLYENAVATQGQAAADADAAAVQAHDAQMQDDTANDTNFWEELFPVNP